MNSTGEHSEHVRDAAQAIDELRSQRHRQLPAHERTLQGLMSRIGSPGFAAAVAVFIVVWVALNMALRSYHESFDSGTFGLLNTIAQVVSIVLIISILSAQNTQSTLEQERARLMLQLAVIQDKKITQALNAIEDLRRVNPKIETTTETDSLHETTDVHEAAQALREVEHNEETK